MLTNKFDAFLKYYLRDRHKKRASVNSQILFFQSNHFLEVWLQQVLVVESENMVSSLLRSIHNSIQF